MEKRLKEYLKAIDARLKQDLPDGERGLLKDSLLIQIRLFQHERLIHLIVTVTFALLTMMTVYCNLYFKNPFIALLTLLLLVLLVPYIRHYFILENGVQKLYTFYDKL